MTIKTIFIEELYIPYEENLYKNIEEDPYLNNMLKNIENLPPLKVIDLGNEYIDRYSLQDGYHRISVYKYKKINKFKVEILNN